MIDVPPIKGWSREMARAYLRRGETALNEKDFRGAALSFKLAAIYSQVAASRQQVCEIRRKEMP